MDNQVAKDVLFEVADVLDAAGVPFFLQCGTALGAYRDGAFIEGDGDIDIGFLLEDTQTSCYKPSAIVSTITELRQRGFNAKGVSKPWNFCRALKLAKNGIHVDICGWMRHGGERFLQSRRKDYALVHPAIIIETVEPVDWLGRTFQIPSPAEKYLESEYGPDWCTPLPPEKCGTFESKNRIYGYLKARGIKP